MMLYRPDQLDGSILRELQNPVSRWSSKRSYARIAKKLLVDEETVRRRVDKMEALGVIRGWTISPNPHVLEKEAIGVYLRLPPGTERQGVLKGLAEAPGVTSAHFFHDDSLLVFGVFASGSGREGEVAQIEMACGTGSVMVLDSKFPPFGLTMTATDWMILGALRGEARRKLSDMAREARVSVKTLNRRLERLVEGRAFYLEVRLDFQKMAGLAYTMVVTYDDAGAKEGADALIIEKLGSAYGWSDTRSDSNHSLFAAFSDNFGEAERLVRWVRTLEGVGDARMGVEEERVEIRGWVDSELRSRGATAPTAKELVAAARFAPPPAPSAKLVEQEKPDSWWTGSLVEGRNVRVTVDADICMGSASCVAMAPKVFRLDWAKKRASMTEGAPLEVLRSKGTDPESLFLAAQSCPYGVIKIEDAETGELLYP